MSQVKAKYKQSSYNAGQFIPEAIKENSESFQTLITAYYDWADSDGEFQKESKILAESFSFNSASDDYILFFKDTLLRLFPDNNRAVLRHLLKFSKVFYAQRGTPESYDFLFRAVWDADVKLSFPSEQILKTSDGVWIERILIKLDTTNFVGSLEGKTIYGTKTQSRALISEVNKVVGNTTEVVLETISSDFIVNETIEIYADNKLEKLLGKTRTVGSLGSYKIINPGKGYLGGTKINIKTDGDGKDFAAEIYSADNISGKIISLHILDSGFDYVYQMPELDLSDKYLFDSRKDKKEIAEIQLIPVANYKEPGRYLKSKSMLSDKFKLHDGYYFQEFSYVLETKLDFEVINKPVMELLHPAGLKMFYNKLYNNTGSQYDFSDTLQPIDGTFSNKPPMTVIYSGNFDYSGPLSVYQ